MKIKDWNNLRFLLALHEGGTMKRAGALLETSPTTVSRHIQELAKECNEMLAQPKKGEVWSLTPYALELVAVADRLVAQLSRLNAADTMEHQKHVSITAEDFILTAYVAPAMNSGLDVMPDIDVSLLCGGDRPLSLAFGEADIALRFEQPQEGQLRSKKVATIPFRIWRNTQNKTNNWVGMSEEMDSLPDMQHGYATFGKPPIIRTSCYSAAKNAAVAVGFNTIGPDAIFTGCTALKSDDQAGYVDRDLWRIIHESRRLDRTLETCKDWVDSIFS